MNTNPIENVFLQFDNLAASTVAFRAHPVGTGPDDPLVRQAVAAAQRLVDLDGKLATIDAGVVPVTKMRELVAGEHARVQIALASLSKSISGAAERLAKAEEKFYLPPPVTTVQDTLADVELRAWFATSPDATAAWEGMGQGKLPELLAALARFGPGATAVRARAVYRSLVVAADRAAVDAFDTEHERIDWAAGVARQISAALGKASMQIGPSVLIEDDAAQRVA